LAAHEQNQGEAREDQEHEGDREEDGAEYVEDMSPTSSRRPTQELSRKMSLPVLPTPKVDASFSIPMDAILGTIKDEDGDDLPELSMSRKQEQRMSRVLKLREENEKLEAELKALRERIAAAEQKSQTLTRTTGHGDK